MSNQEFFLSDFISVKHGFAFKGDFITTEENENCLLTPGNFMIGGGFKSDKFKYFSGDIPQDYILKEDDLIITMTDLSKQGDTLGYSALVPSIYGKKMLHNQRIGLVEFKNNELDKHYLYFLLRSHEYRSYILGCSTGSTVRHTSPSKIVSFKFVKPDLETQKKIANKLLSLEKKIELNTQINQTLEQIAQALFKSWFVDFDPVRAKVQALSDGLNLEQVELAAMQAISGKTPEELTALSQTQPDRYAELAETAKAFPCEMVEIDGGEVPKGWEKTTLSEICEMQNGYAFKSSDWMEQGIPVIKIGSVKPMIVEVEGNGFVSEDYSKLKPDFLLTSGDILVGLTGYVGEVGRIPTGKIAMLNQRVATFLPKEIDKNHCFYNYIYCLARQSQFKEFAEINAKGSAQANISTKELLKFPIIKANDKLHILFENRVKELLERILWNSQNAETLAKTRDLLLPRLLNGE
ncbi:TPA: restriction endonuclease subunit S [Haemophilus influenzae]|nr:restriction endonuclease subunit S [Haemophilus influenzae]RFN83355.1 restriction endonuclease subunit S [Haemophilus influenzae]